MCRLGPMLGNAQRQRQTDRLTDGQHYHANGLSVRSSNKCGDLAFTIKFRYRQL